MPAKTQKMVLFRVGKRQYGIHMPHVKNIQGVDDISESLKVPRFDLSLLFGDNSITEEAKNKKLIMIDQNNQQLAFIVDGVDGVINADEHQIVPLPPVFEGHSRLCFPRVFTHGEQIILLINPEAIIDAEEMVPAADLPEPEPTPLDNLDDLEVNMESIPSPDEGDEIEYAKLNGMDTIPEELNIEPKPVPVEEMSETGTDEGIIEPETVETPMENDELSIPDRLETNFPKPDENDDPLSKEIDVEKLIDMKNLERILTRVVKEKVAGKLKNIFDEALLEPRLRA